MSNVLAFKCYFLNGEEKEIRRFTVDSDVVGNFTYVKEKIRSLYPELLRENFRVMYVDDENDKIVISSDDELVAAIMYAKRAEGEPFRLFVQVIPGGQAKSNPATGTGTGNCQGEIHWGVTCDGCQGAVRGFRYKCMNCPDYDLCGKCEAAGLHPGHTFMRVTGPLPQCFGAMRQMLHPGAEIPHWRRRHHGRFGRCNPHHGRWNAWCPTGIEIEIDSEPEPAKKSKADESEEPKRCPFKSNLEQAKQAAQAFQANGPEYLTLVGNSLASILERFGIDTLVDVHPPGARACPRSTASQKKDGGAAADAAQGGKSEQEKAAPPKTGFEQVFETHGPQYLANVVNALSAMFEQFGIQPDVTFGVNGAASSPCAQKKDESAATPEKPKEGSPKKEVIIPVVLEEGKAESNPKKEVIIPVVVEEKKTESAKEVIIPVQMETDVETDKEAQAATTTTDSSPYAGVVREVAAAQQAESVTQSLSSSRPTTPPKSPSRDSGDWTMVDDEKITTTAEPVRRSSADLGARPKENMKTDAATNQGQQNYRPMPNPPLHPDPVVANALETMLNMGFTNEGGWLSQLLEVKGGDIGKALDVLQAHFHRPQ